MFLFLIFLLSLVVVNNGIGVLSDETTPHNAIVWVLNGGGSNGEPHQKHAPPPEIIQVSRLKRSVGSVVRHYLKPFNKKPSDVALIVFYNEHNLSTSWQSELQSIYPAIKFVDVTHHPSFQDPHWRSHPYTWDLTCNAWWGEHQELENRLNSFLLNGFFEHQALDHFTYLLRFEVDVLFQKDLQFDPFKKAHEMNVGFAYPESFLENPGFVDGLPEAIGRFVRKHRITPKQKNLRHINPLIAFSGKFGLFKMSDWRNSLLRELSQTLVLHERGVYCNHWTNQNVIALLSYLFLQKERVALWPDLIPPSSSSEAASASFINNDSISSQSKWKKQNDLLCQEHFGPATCSDYWDVVLSPVRNAVVTYALDQLVGPGLRVLHRSLINSGSLENALFIVLDFALPGKFRNELRSEGILLDYSHSNKNLSTTHSFFTTRYQSVQWRMFSKLNIFGFDYLDRAVYMDADTIAYRSIAPLLDRSVTRAVKAPTEHPEFEPEFNAGFFVYDPSETIFDDMLLHLNDDYAECGYRVEDQSFLCHYFLGKWEPLEHGYHINYQDFNYNHEALKTAHVLHYNGGPKPWDPDAHNNDKFYNAWFDLAATLDPLPAIQNTALLEELLTKKKKLLH